MKKIFVCFLLVLINLAFPQELFDFVERYKEVSYNIVSEKITESNFKLIHVILKSQTWRGFDWKHDVLMIVPPRIEFDKAGVLFITGDFDPTRMRDVEDFLWVAEKFSAPFVVLGDVPNQPIFGLREDDLIAHTFLKYGETEDFTWPLLFPMTTAAVATMDVAQQILNVEKFFVTGPSKRGWTTWLTAVVDERVFAIAPIVFDNLNFPKQLEQQLKMYGEYSRSISPYVERGLPEYVNTEVGRKLLKMVDPYSYKERLTMPKYIVNATNDEYWTIYSANLYFFDLPGKNYLLYVPNNSHGIKNVPYVVENASAFFKLTLKNALPKVDFTICNGTIQIEHNAMIKQVYLHRAVSDTTDFRKSLWFRFPVLPEEGVYSISVEPPVNRHVAYYAEVVLEVEGLTMSLCTPGVYK
ncbi:PhoPQ-activated protein PqaA family protein [Pseudothermotoga sp.]|uniref:PhoPQ-activated protein PqaA family protein n=1 Tax=Pseudothermotoga sp. TaxID=2033661 RepID=UPI0031F6C54E